MKLSVTMTAENKEELDALLQAVDQIQGGGSSEPAEPPKKPAKKAAAKKAAAKKEDPPEEEETEEEEGEEENSGPSRDDVKNALKSYAAIEGKDAAITILKETGGASSINELDEDKYQAVIDACDA